MIKAVIRFSATNRFLVLLATAVFVGYGVYTLNHIPVDAIPDLSDTQVIVYSRWDRSPDIMEDQVTYPIVTALLGAPNVKVVRGFSDFGFSYVYVIFKDGTDIYWARSRVLEYLSKIQPLLPAGVRTELGPDATGVGWVFQYALVDDSGTQSLADLRTLQDWNLRYRLQSVPGVAEVASLGGFVQQYQVTVDPNRLRAYELAIMDVAEAIRRSNNEVGGRLLEFSGKEYMVRGRGYVRGTEDLEKIVLKTDEKGTPVLLRDVGQVALGPEMRRGVSDLDGLGDTVNGIVVMRHGENAREVIRRVRERLREIEPSLPKGVRFVTTYDRSELIQRAIDTLTHELVLQIAIVSLVILVFLWHIPSAIVPIVTIPVAVLLAFIPMWWMGISSNVMSLAGIAISIGVLVDGAIVEVENAYKKLELWDRGGRKGDFHAVRLEALLEVGPSVFFSLLVIAVAFFPIFTLVDQEGRLFKPLAWTKNLAMAIAAVLALTLDPALRMLFARMDFVHFRPRWLSWLFNQVTRGPLLPGGEAPDQPRSVRSLRAGLPCRSAPSQDHDRDRRPRRRHDHTGLPRARPRVHAAPERGRHPLHADDAPRDLGDRGEPAAPGPGPAAQVVPRGGARARQGGPRRDLHRPRPLLDDGDDRRPEAAVRVEGEAPLLLLLGARMAQRPGPRAGSGRTGSRTRSWSTRWTGSSRSRAPRTPGPCRSRTGSTCSRPASAPRSGSRSSGPTSPRSRGSARASSRSCAACPGTRSVYAERVAGGYFVDFDLNRDELARYGLTVAAAQDVVMSAVGGENVSTTIEGRARFPVNVRYPRELRDDLEQLGRVLVMTPSGAQIPLSQVADIRMVTGPAMIRNENGLLAGYVYVDMVESDIGGYVERAKQAVAKGASLPSGYSLEWSGQYENMLRVRERLKLVVPLTIFTIFFLLYMNTKSGVKAGIVMLAVPFSVVGAVWLMYLLDYNVSIAAWVGMIALMGLDAETGVFMLLFLDLAYDEAKAKGRLRSLAELHEAIIHGAVKRVRPKMMTVTAAFMGLMPIMWSTGSGSDVMKRVAAPMVGGLATSFLMELLVYPAIYLLWKWHTEVRYEAEPAGA